MLIKYNTTSTKLKRKLHAHEDLYWSEVGVTTNGYVTLSLSWAMIAEEITIMAL